MLRFVLRLGGTVLLAAAVAVLLSDVTRSVTASHLVLTTTQQLLATSLTTAGTFTVDDSGGPVGLIGPLGALVRYLPACLPLAAVGALLLVVGRARPPGIGYVPR